MNHYVKPTLDRNPELLVLHVGTNDVRRKEPQEIANEIESLCRSIVNGMTRIVKSEIIQRQSRNQRLSRDKREITCEQDGGVFCSSRQ